MPIDRHPDAALLALETRLREIDHVAAQVRNAMDGLSFSHRPKVPDILLKQVTLANGETTRRPYATRQEIDRDFESIGMFNTSPHKAVRIAWEEYEAGCAAVDASPEIVRLRDEAARLTAERAKIARQIAATPAQTIEGVIVKLRLVAEAEPPVAGAAEIGTARSALADCERMAPTAAGPRIDHDVVGGPEPPLAAAAAPTGAILRNAAEIEDELLRIRHQAGVALLLGERLGERTDTAGAGAAFAIHDGLWRIRETLHRLIFERTGGPLGC